MRERYLRLVKAVVNGERDLVIGGEGLLSVHVLLRIRVQLSLIVALLLLEVEHMLSLVDANGTGNA